MIPSTPSGGGGMTTRFLRPAEVCKTLSVSRSWLYEAAREGRIPSGRRCGPDGPRRFPEDQLEM